MTDSPILKTLSAALGCLLAAWAAPAKAQDHDILARADDPTAIAIGYGAHARATTGVMDGAGGVRTLRSRTFSGDTAAVALGAASRARVDVGRVSPGARARRVDIGAGADDVIALSVTPGTASVNVGGVCRGRFGAVHTRAYARDVAAVNVGFWTPLPSRVNIGTVGRGC